MSGSDAFACERYEIAPSAACGHAIRLEAGVGADAERLGTGLAAIDPWARYPYPASALAAFFAASEPDAPRFCVRVGPELAGVVGLRLNWLRGPYLQFLGLLPPFQRAGIGSALLGWIEAEARAHGERNLWVLASDFNREAIRFYERHGFAIVAPLEGLVRDDRTEILLRKRLQSPD